MRVLPALAVLFTSTTAFAADPPKLTDAPKPPPGFPSFKVQEIDTGLKIGYAVIAVDIDGDKKPDIVVVDQHKVVWYQNPTWQKRVILDGKTKPDNVCITAVDIDGDKLPELVVGAGWKPFDTANPGTLQWLKRGKTLDDEWTMHKLPCAEPTVHRVRAIDIDGDGKPEIVHVPLMGVDSTAAKNWQDGRPSRVIALKVPAKDPEKTENWKPEVLNDELRVCHNFAPFPQGKTMDIVVVNYDGLHLLTKGKPGEVWKATRIGEGDQSNPKGSRGASEVATGSLEYARIFGERDLGGILTPNAYIATVEPWHGNKIVVYDNVGDGPGKLLPRSVIDEQLRWGHAVKFASLEPRPTRNDSNKGPELVQNLIVGVRDNPTKDDKFTEKRGVRIYRLNEKTKKWDRYILEDGGVAVEDLIVEDLNGDGKPDIVAVGRATGNARIYWNQGR